jgi:hypothetical protein
MLTKSVIAEHRVLYVASSILAFVKVHPLCRPHFPYCSSLTCSSHSTFFPPTLSVANCPSSLGSHSANRARTVHSIDRHVTSFGTRPGRSVEYTSRRHWCLIQPATVRLPSIRIDTRAGAARRRARFRRAAAQSRMRAMTVVVALEIEEFHLQIRCGPEQGAVQTLTTNRFNEPFNEGMGEWQVWDGLDFSDVENPQIGLPLVGAIQGIMIGAEVFRRGLARVARLNIRHSDMPSTTPRWTANPTMRRVHWSITTSTQCVRRTADSHRKRSRLHRLSFVCPRSVSQDGRAESGVGWYRTARMRRTTSLLIGRRKRNVDPLIDRH